MNVLLSWFEPAGPDAMIPNFGGFLQFELADLLGNGNGLDYGILAQFEYMITPKITPYLRGGYVPVFKSGSSTVTTGDYTAKAALGCFMTPVHFFFMDVRFELNTTNGKIDKSLLGSVFTIRL